VPGGPPRRRRSRGRFRRRPQRLDLAKEFDYRNANDHPAFAGRNTSAENLAAYFGERLGFRSLGATRIAEVTVWGADNRAT
jgi:hypothetical protein